MNNLIYINERNILLLEPMVEYCKEYYDNDKYGMFQPYKLANIIYHIKNEYYFATPNDLRVYQTLGIDQKKILEFDKQLLLSLKIYEKLLNHNHLSLNDKLKDNEYYELTRIHKLQLKK